MVEAMAALGASGTMMLIGVLTNGPVIAYIGNGGIPNGYAGYSAVRIDTI